jgi:IMP cyclohydrolase
VKVVKKQYKPTGLWVEVIILEIKILVEDKVEGIIKTDAFDASKVEDPSLIIYNALRTVRLINRSHIVSNGDQTDTVYDRLWYASRFSDSTVNHAFRNALLGREFEPDTPNFTPRITGMFYQGTASYDYSIIRRNPITGLPVHTSSSGKLEDIPEGAGICFHTYAGDGDPLPAFDGNPYAISVQSTAAETAEALWESLDRENRVAIVAKTINLRTGIIKHEIINQL